MDKFIGEEEELKIPQCHNCIHYASGLICAAFPRIPIEIYMNRHNHRQPYPGDNGIQFEAIDDNNPGTRQTESQT